MWPETLQLVVFYIGPMYAYMYICIIVYTYVCINPRISIVVATDRYNVKRNARSH